LISCWLLTAVIPAGRSARS